MMSNTTRQMFLWGAVTAVVASLVAGIVLIGSPQDERNRRLDNLREQDLRRISNMVNLYWQRHERLPASLTELSTERGIAVPQNDPEGVRYEYRLLGEERKYELCAQFARDSAQDSGARRDDFWTHGSGRQCYTLKAKELRR